METIDEFKWQSLKKYRPNSMCIFCHKTQGFGTNLIDLPIISSYYCEHCRDNITIGELTKSLKWHPTVIKNKIINQITKTKNNE